MVYRMKKKEDYNPFYVLGVMLFVAVLIAFVFVTDAIGDTESNELKNR
jgi:hypothetical protein